MSTNINPPGGWAGEKFWADAQIGMFDLEMAAATNIPTTLMP